MNSYFENFTVELHVLYAFDMHANFYTNHMLFTIQSINSYFMQYFKLEKLEFKKLINDMTIDLCHLEILQIWRIYKDNVIQQICQNLNPIKKILSSVILHRVTPDVT